MHQAENLAKSIHEELKAGLYVWHMLNISANLKLNMLINIKFIKKKQIDEPNENYEEDLSKEAEDIINTLNPWKIDEWVAVLYNNSWYSGVIRYYSSIISIVARNVRAC